jgi:4-amino-4-deoxychorismate lyase
MNRVLVNGSTAGNIDHRDRGLHYGDGVFETMRVIDGRIRLEHYHLERLAEGLRRLKIAAPPALSLNRELRRSARTLHSGVLKLLVTRGSGERGYRPSGRERTSRILIASPAPHEPSFAEQATRLRVCALILSDQPLLAGMKTLNRLEAVLARSEWRDSNIFDGLLRDGQGNLVCGTMSNLFLRQGERLLTPALERCGVKGVMRRWVMQEGAGLKLKVIERSIGWSDLRAADEVFVSNAVVGLKSVRSIEWRARGRRLRYGSFEAAAGLRERLALV